MREYSMKPFYFVVMDGVFDHSMRWVVSYEMQKALSSWVNPNALSRLFGKEKRIYHLTPGTIDIDGGLNHCESVQQVLSLGDRNFNDSDYLLLDSGLTIVPKDFPGLLDMTNDWFWRMMLTHKAVFRWVSDKCMPNWNPTYEYYTKEELLNILDDESSFNGFAEIFNWKKETDTIFIKSPMASRGEGNKEVSYHSERKILRDIVENFSSDCLLVEAAKGYSLDHEQDKAEEGCHFQTSRVGIFYRPDRGVKVVEMCKTQHPSYNSHHAKKRKLEEVSTVDNTTEFLAFFENMRAWNTIKEINELLQQSPLTEGKKDLCRQVLHTYLKHFYTVYTINFAITADQEQADLLHLLNFIKYYLECTNYSIIDLARGENPPRHARLFIAMLSTLAFYTEHEDVMSLLISHYGNIESIQDDISDLVPNNWNFILSYLCSNQSNEELSAAPIDESSYRSS